MIPVTDEQLRGIARVIAKAWGAPPERIQGLADEYVALYRQRESQLMADFCLLIEGTK